MHRPIMKEERLKFLNPERITTTRKALRITQTWFNIIYIMRTSINQGRIQSLAVMIVMLINNDQTPYLTYYRILGLTVHATSTHCFQLPSPRSPENLSVMKSSRYPVLLESFWQSHSGFHASALPGISAPLLSPKMSRINFIDCRFCLWMR